ncbi:MAG: 6-hydroxymethylpterin diphosphokinase MptE-like protein [Bacteroidota bacterium]
MKNIFILLDAIKSKFKYIIREEGFSIFIRRTFSFGLFYLKLFLYWNIFDKSHFSNIKNLHSGGRIFILGNGPSLNKTELYLLKNEQVLCSNRFMLMLERLDFVPQYYSCIDDRVLSTISTDIFNLSSKVQYMFLPLIHPSSGKNFFKFYKNIKNVYWLILSRFGYSLDLPYVGINKSVTNCSLQIAAFMGFSEIYLLGVDMDYDDHKSVTKENSRDWTSKKDDDPNHFDPRYFGKGTQYHHPRLDETFKKWEEAESFFEKKGVKIYNATVGGKLEIFERVKLKDVIGLNDKEEMLLFLNKFGIQDYISNNLIDYFHDAVVIMSPAEFNLYNEKIIMDTETAIKLIPKQIFNYIPYGPIFNQYIFIRRGKTE